MTLYISFRRYYISFRRYYGKVFGVFDKIGCELGIQNDKTRGTVWYLGINVRAGLAGRGERHILQGVSRHMIDPVRRDIDIVATQNKSQAETQLKNKDGEGYNIAVVSNTAELEEAASNKKVHKILFTKEIVEKTIKNTPNKEERIAQLLNTGSLYTFQAVSPNTGKGHIVTVPGGEELHELVEQYNGMASYEQERASARYLKSLNEQDRKIILEVMKDEIQKTSNCSGGCNPSKYSEKQFEDLLQKNSLLAQRVKELEQLLIAHDILILHVKELEDQLRGCNSQQDKYEQKLPIPDPTNSEEKIKCLLQEKQTGLEKIKKLESQLLDHMIKTEDKELLEKLTKTNDELLTSNGNNKEELIKAHVNIMTQRIARIDEINNATKDQYKKLLRIWTSGDNFLKWCSYENVKIPDTTADKELVGVEFKYVFQRLMTPALDKLTNENKKAIDLIIKLNPNVLETYKNSGGEDTFKKQFSTVESYENVISMLKNLEKSNPNYGNTINEQISSYYNAKKEHGSVEGRLILLQNVLDKNKSIQDLKQGALNAALEIKQAQQDAERMRKASVNKLITRGETALKVCLNPDNEDKIAKHSLLVGWMKKEKPNKDIIDYFTTTEKNGLSNQSNGIFSNMLYKEELEVIIGMFTKIKEDDLQQSKTSFGQFLDKVICVASEKLNSLNGCKTPEAINYANKWTLTKPPIEIPEPPLLDFLAPNSNEIPEAPPLDLS